MAREEEIRELVRRVVEEAAAGANPAKAPSPAVPSTTAKNSEAANSEAVALGADHGGYALKEKLKDVVAGLGYRVVDCGTFGPGSVDYPDFAHAVARKVASNACRWGIVVDGAGIGSAMVANKVPGIRAALCYDLSSAKNSREHNHSNVLTLGAGLIGDGLARQIVETWLATPWGEGRHARRAGKITEVEMCYAAPRGS